MPTALTSNHLVRELLKHGADPNAVAVSGPWHVSVLANAIEGLENNRYNIGALPILLEHGASVHMVDEGGRTPLMLALRYHVDSAVPLFIKHGADARAVDNNGWSVLHHAATTQTPSHVIAHLIAAGADINAQDSQGFTPLARAINRNMLETMEVFLQNGADLFVVPRLDPWHTVLHHAVLPKKGDGRKALFFLLAERSDPWRKGVAQLINVCYASTGWSPLHAAVSASDNACVRELVRAGADPFMPAIAQGRPGPTSADIAAYILFNPPNQSEGPEGRRKARIRALKIFRFFESYRQIPVNAGPARQTRVTYHTS
jgi:ankyrin repeat protein